MNNYTRLQLILICTYEINIDDEKLKNVNAHTYGDKNLTMLYDIVLRSLLMSYSKMKM